MHTALKFGVFFIVNRWKGENVATTEVADVVTVVDCIKEANVYGVEVPGNFTLHLLLFWYVSRNN